MQTGLNCQNCGGVGNLSCGKCFSGYYCSADCQRSDWPRHKAACARIADTTKCNPWYAPESSVEPKFVHPQLMDISEYREHIGSKNINTLRGARGETLLHAAVISGDIKSVKYLVENGAYVDSIDWMRNTPLYYACSHNGIEDSDLIYNYPACEDTVEETALGTNRLEIVKYLVSAGADTMMQGGYSSMRSFEAAKHYGHDEIAEHIEGSEEHKKLCAVRALVNKSDDRVVKHLIDVFWRADTCHWLIQPNRNYMALNINPHPELLWVVKDGKSLRPNINDIESMFVDLSLRHKKFHAELMKN